ncbi:hypothetical protein M422DRAFT_248780 [Sphaerobolus stellatus SS14]|nr:hypothetical protein M422DRAFT_248780 [Sphaerobolus stellatus SS14]
MSILILLVYTVSLLNSLTDVAPIHDISPSILSDFVSNSTSQCAMTNASGSNQRSVWDIFWSCVDTTFVVTWLSVHPNIPSPGEKWWWVTWRRMKAMFWALMFPEGMILWAARQYHGVREISTQITKLKSRCKPFEGYIWTKRHSHYLQMGGFLVNGAKRGARRRSAGASPYFYYDYDIGEQTYVLTEGDFYHLIAYNAIDIPTITAEEIKDRSKSDSLAKAIATVQILWFVTQTIARHIQKQSVTQLELTTAALAALTIIMYLYWWHKPMEIQVGTMLRLCQPAIGSDPEDDGRGEEDVSQANPGLQTSPDSQTEISTLDPDSTHVVDQQEPEAAMEIETIHPQPLRFESQDSEMTLLTKRRSITGSDPANSGLCEDGLYKNSGLKASFDSPTEKYTPDPDSTYSINHAEPETANAGGINHLLPLGLEASESKGSSSLFAMFKDVGGATTSRLKQSISKHGYFITFVWNIWIAWPIINPLKEIWSGKEEGIPADRLPIFYHIEEPEVAEEDEYYQWRVGIGMGFGLIAGLAFGPIHLIAWSFSFPTHTEKLLWRIAGCVVTSLPVSLLMTGVLVVLAELSPAAFAITLVGYFPSRVFLLLEGILALRNLPPSALDSAEWLSFIPHI